jgi:hypothetical protein
VAELSGAAFRSYRKPLSGGRDSGAIYIHLEFGFAGGVLQICPEFIHVAGEQIEHDGQQIEQVAAAYRNK